MHFSKGFSLIELCIVLLLVAILVMFGMTTLQFLLTRQNERHVADLLLLALDEARMLAIFHGMPVTLCASTDGMHCLDTWQGQLLLFADSEQKGMLIQQEFLFHQYALIFRKSELHWRSFPHMNYLHWLSTGFTKAENGTFWYCPAAANDPAWAIMVSQSGRARLLYPNKNHPIRDEKGKLLVCR